MITFKELQTLSDIFSKPVPDNPILSDIEDTLECAVIGGRTYFNYVSLKYDKETVDEAIQELEKCGYDCSHYSYDDGNLIMEFRWQRDEAEIDAEGFKDFEVKNKNVQRDTKKVLEIEKKNSIKEFAEKLQKELPCRDYTFNGITYSMILTSSAKYVIDKLLKESMDEAQND